MKTLVIVAALLVVGIVPFHPVYPPSYPIHPVQPPSYPIHPVLPPL